MKKFFAKIWGGIKKPFAFIKRKTEPAREFMKAGRPGGMIAEMITATLMCGWVAESYVYHKISWMLSALIMAALMILMAEALNLVLKLLFGAGKRCKSYFAIALFGVIFMNMMGNQVNAVGPAVIGCRYHRQMHPGIYQDPQRQTGFCICGHGTFGGLSGVLSFLFLLGQLRKEQN